MTDWIRIKDRVPLDNEEYLVYTKYYNVKIRHFLPFMNDFSEDFVTHWMPLPEPPK